MRRAEEGTMRLRGVNNPLETIHAAARAIATEENRSPEAPSQKRRWRSFWRLYWCFGSQKRIKHAVIVPETVEYPTQTLSIILPFIAPPSSPASSFFQSEPPSSTQSPTGIFSQYSPSGHGPGPIPSTMFDIGPYAYETQLVTPPVFSTYTTEPSTAPVTPPESLRLTTPSSPEVPFSHLLNPTFETTYEFQPHLLHPGSPFSNLISPCSGISNSGTSSPFLNTGKLYFLEFKNGDHSKLLNLEKTRAWGDDDHRVSFERTTEEVVRCVEKNEEQNGHQEEVPITGDSSDHRMISLGCSKEFNFGNIDTEKSSISSDWWANEKVVLGEEGTTLKTPKNWSFFTTVQPSIK